MKSFFDLPIFSSEVAFAMEASEMDTALATVMSPNLNFEDVRNDWLNALEISELTSVARQLNLNWIKVIRARDPSHSAGFCYLRDNYSILGQCDLVQIDDAEIPPHLNLVDVFLHEICHVFCGELHDWKFLVTLNILRLECGLGASVDGYDCRDELSEDPANTAISVLSAARSLAPELLTARSYPDAWQVFHAALANYPSHRQASQLLAECKVVRSSLKARDSARR